MEMLLFSAHRRSSTGRDVASSIAMSCAPAHAKIIVVGIALPLQSFFIIGVQRQPVCVSGQELA